MGGWWAYRVRRCTVPLVGAVVLCGACVLGAAASPAPVPPTPTTSAAVSPAAPFEAVRVLQMNLCNSGVAGCYTGRSVAEAAAVVRTEAPDVITLNEVCEDDVAVLERTLAAARPGDAVASAFHAAGDRRTGGVLRCRSGHPYGVGLVARLGRPARTYTSAGGVYPVQDSDSHEQRAWVCLGPDEDAPAAGAFAACTTHLDNRSAIVARAQCAFLLGTAVPAVRARGAAAPVVLGGDLNLTTGDPVDLRPCVPDGDRHADDGVVQHVVATPEFTLGSRRTIGMRETDHPGLLVTLALP